MRRCHEPCPCPSLPLRTGLAQLQQQLQLQQQQLQQQVIQSQAQPFGKLRQILWWKKSCTALVGWNPFNDGINHLSAGAGSIHFVSPNVPVLKSIFGTVGFETPYPTWWFLKVGASPSHHGCFNTKSWSIAWMILGYPHGKSLGLIHWVQLTWVGSVPTSVPLSRRMWWCHRHRHLCLQMHPKCLGHAVCWWEPGKVTHPNQGWFIPLISGCWWLISPE